MVCGVECRVGIMFWFLLGEIFEKKGLGFFFFIGWWCNFGYLVLKVSRGFF